MIKQIQKLLPGLMVLLFVLGAEGICTGFASETKEPLVIISTEKRGKQV